MHNNKYGSDILGTLGVQKCKKESKLSTKVRSDYQRRTILSYIMTQKNVQGKLKFTKN